MDIFGWLILGLLAGGISGWFVGTRSVSGSALLWKEMRFGWDYIMVRKGLLALLVFYMIFNFLSGVVGPLLVPLMTVPKSQLSIQPASAAMPTALPPELTISRPPDLTVVKFAVPPLETY